MRFTVVVPAYNVQGYLRQAVMSVAGREDTEVIIVDDRSTDDTSRLADELAATHPTARVVRPDVNGGLGRARNLGLAVARGEYVVFLDGDDYFAEGALDRIAAEIDAHAPDIVMFGYARLYPNGKAEEGIIRKPLQGGEPFTAKQRPEIYTVLNVAWNKAYRREFVAAQGIEFPPGYYEDIPWTYPLLAQARSIVGIDEPLYLYRQRWSGSILRSTDVRHLEILEQFDRLMEILEASDIEPEQFEAIFHCAYRNLSTLVTHQRHRIPAQYRRQFFLDVQESVRHHAPEGYTPPQSGHQSREMRWILTQDYSRFAAELKARSAARTVRAKARLVARAGKRATHRNGQRRLVFRAVASRTAVEPDLAVFENLWGRSPRMNALAVAHKLRETHPEVRIAWLVREGENHGIPDGMEAIMHGSQQHFSALAKAKYLFTDANFPAWWKKQPGQIVTQLHHGTPLKYMGVEERGKSPAWRDGLLRRCSTWDFSVVSNAYSAEVWKHSYPVRCETLEVGYPRNDALVAPAPEQIAHAREAVGIADAERVILYMPTHRNEFLEGAVRPDIAAFAGSLDDGDVLLVRDHYFSERVKEAAQEGIAARVLDVSDHGDVNELYLASDLLVTDYSSAMFDYAILRKPIVIFAHDIDAYREQRGMYFDITQDAPGAVALTVDELSDVVASRTYASQENHEKLSLFADYFTEFENGRASADVIARVVDGVELPAHARTPHRSPVTTWNLDRVG